MMYQLSPEDEEAFDDGFGSWVEQCFLEHLGLTKPPFCPNYDDDIDDRMSYQDRRRVQEANYEAWKASPDGLEYARVKEAVSKALDALGVEWSHAGAYDFQVPILTWGKVHFASWTETLPAYEVDTNDIERAKVAFKEFARITKLDQLTDTPSIGLLCWGSWG